MQRRHAGKTPIPLDELDDIEAVTGIDAEYLLTGINAGTPPTGGGVRKSLHTESNRRPFHYKREGSHKVVELHPVEESDEELFATAS